MNKALKIVAIMAGLVVVLCCVLFLLAEPVLNSTAVKSRIERIVGEALDMNFKIEGRIGIGFFPILSLVTNDVNVSITTDKIASAERIEIAPRLLALLSRKIHIKDVDIQSPQLTFRRQALEKILALRKGKSDDHQPVESLVIDSFSISKAKFFYSDDQTIVDLHEMNFGGGGVTIIEDRKVVIDDVVSFFRAINFKGDVSAEKISSQDFRLANIKANVKNENGILTGDPIELEYLGSAAKLHATLDLSQEKPFLKSHVNLSGLNIGPLAKRLYPDGKIKGKLNITAKVSVAEIDINRILKSTPKTEQPGELVAKDVLPVKSLRVGAFKVAGTGVTFSVGTISIENAKLNLTDSQLPIIENNRLTVKDMKRLLQKAKFNGKIQINKISIMDDFVFEKIRIPIRGDRGILQSDPVELVYFGARTKIAGLLNVQKNVNHLKVRIEMPEVDLGKLLEETEDWEIAKGVIHIKGQFETRAAVLDEMLKNTNGDFSIKGKNLILKGVDLDKALDQFKKMQGYGFIDFTAFIYLGPLGTIVSHGYDQIKALEKIMAAKGDSMIQQVVSDWNVVGGVATAKDVAFSTRRHRVAVQGSIDMPNERFKNLTIALVDLDGCIVNSETVDGAFEKPDIKEVSVIARLVTRPLKRLLKVKCDFFYDGAVPHPTGAKREKREKEGRP